MVSEHDMVVLMVSLPQEKLQAGDVGTVVHVYKQGQAYEVEFSTMSSGHFFALVTLEADKVRPLSDRDLFHVRQLAA
jgi:hypothetical protein